MAAWMLHGAASPKEAGARNLVFFRVNWLQPAMKGTSCVRRVRLRSFHARIGSSSVFGNEWLLLVVPVCVVLCVSWISGCRSHWNGCMIVVMLCCDVRREMRVSYTGCMNVAWAMFWGGSRSTKPCIFPCKVAAAGDERYLVCATGAAAVVSCANWFPLCILQRVVVPVCVVLCVSWISGCRSHWNGCMIVVTWCCHLRREMRVSDVMLRNALYRGCMRNTIVFCSWRLYWSGCIQAATVICQQIFAILVLIIFLLKILFKSASKSSFFCFGDEIRFWSCKFRRRCA